MILIAVLSVAGCAETGAPASADRATASVRASILVVRPVPATASQDMTARALGSAPAHPLNLAEFIVRTEDGRTLSVVQPAEADLKPGTQALLTAGSRPRLTNLPTGAGMPKSQAANS